MFKAVYILNVGVRVTINIFLYRLKSEVVKRKKHVLSVTYCALEGTGVDGSIRLRWIFKRRGACSGFIWLSTEKGGGLL